MKKKSDERKKADEKEWEGKEWKGEEKWALKSVRGVVTLFLIQFSYLIGEKKKNKERWRKKEETRRKSKKWRREKRQEGRMYQHWISFFISFHSLISSLSSPFILFTFQSLFHSFEFLHKFMISSSLVN